MDIVHNRKEETTNTCNRMDKPQKATMLGKGILITRIHYK